MRAVTERPREESAKPQTSEIEPSPPALHRAGIWPKLAVSLPSDPHEQEADRIADQVMRSEASGGCTGCADEPTPCDDCGKAADGSVQRKAAGPTVHPSAPLKLGLGRPLEPGVRDQMERRFGADFSGVSVHTEGQAEASAKSINARAFTWGTSIAFAQGEYSPQNGRGAHLLAHELTHVLQGSPGASPSVFRQPDSEAEAMGVGPDAFPRLESALEDARSDMDQDDDLGLRAYATRVHWLLTWRSHPRLETVAQVDAFVAQCHDLAVNEIDALQGLPQGQSQLALAFAAQGFPLTWAGRVRSALSLGTDPTAVLTEWMVHVVGLHVFTALLPGALAQRGLPIPFDGFDRISDGKFHLLMADRELAGQSPVGDFAVEAIRHMQLKWVTAFALTWERYVDSAADAIASGEVVASYPDWRDFVDNKQAILRGLPDRARNMLARSEEEAQELADSGLQLADAAAAVGILSAFAAIAGIFTGWSEAAALFDQALEAGDQLVRGADGGEKLIRAFRWAHENGYNAAALSASVDNLIAHGPEILGETALILALGMIPVVDVGVAIYLAFTTARDVLSSIADMTSAMGEATGANSVVGLQRAARHLAVASANGGLQVATTIATLGVAKVTVKVRARARALRAAEPALSEQAAMRKAFEELPAAEQRTLTEGTVREASDAQAAQARASDPASVPHTERSTGVAETPPRGSATAGVNPETVAMLDRNPALRQALDRSPRAMRALRKCASPCYPDFATASQIDRLERLLARAEDSGLTYDPARLTSYLRGTRTWAELDLALGSLARDLERKIGVRGAFDDASRLGPDTTPAGQVPTTVLRAQPGVARGGERLPSGTEMFPATPGGADIRVAMFPRSVAARMRGMQFANFDAFRETFWRMVASDANLRRSFAYYPENLARMQSGLAPWVPSRRVGAGRVESVGRGANAVYQLNHKQALKNAGDVYNMDNLEIVTPRFHGEIGD